MKLRTTTSVKIETETVRMDLTMPKGLPLVSAIETLIDLVYKVEDLETIKAYLEKTILSKSKDTE